MTLRCKSIKILFDEWKRQVFGIKVSWRGSPLVSLERPVCTVTKSFGILYVPDLSKRGNLDHGLQIIAARDKSSRDLSL